MTFVSAIIELLGGLAMFLYGIEVMGDGLKNSSGEALKRVLEKVTGNVVVGVLTGCLVTAVIQSSTATIVLTVALIGAGVLNLKQAVSIVMGANIGTTITAQIIRLGFVESDGGNWLLWLFDTDTLAPIALVIGIILIMFVKKKSAKPIGDICIGFGVLFVGLNLMTSGVKPLIGTDVFESFLTYLSNPILGLLFGLVLTVIVQSSSATVGMLQTVAAATATAALSDPNAVVVTFAMAYPIIMGINIGTCVTTAMVCSIGTSKDAKRTGVVHIAFNTIGTIGFFIAMSVMQHFEVFGSEFWVRVVDGGGIADFQTVFNLLTAVILIPFADYLVKLSCFLVKDDAPQEIKHPELHTLSENLIISPAVAVSETSKAVSAMASIVKENFKRGCQQLINYTEGLTTIINEEENELDLFADSSSKFMIELSKNLENETENHLLEMMLQTVPNLERIGDYATNLDELGESLKKDGSSFSEMALKELDILTSAVNEIIDITVGALEENDLNKAEMIEPLEETIDDVVMLLRAKHTKRLKNGECSISSGLVFMEALTYFERASDQCSSIAVLMLAQDNQDILLNHHEFLHNMHKNGGMKYSEMRNARIQQYIEPLKVID
ncbi:MAG: Na/Pi cotransporter family protein [Erysipelotrichaceae bacterium]|nr:Na/Pi cotransporter family protein [Erysipelotrichaceae bacterium]